MTDTLTIKPKIRCAIYTRKSNEDGLEQEFNSIDAQRLSGENFIASQIGKGWVLVETHYDDEGFSGGTLERPALKRLMNDIQNDKVDCVVIYKIDRLSRSLFDFQKIIDIFEKKKVSFASVTQNFTTDDSIGRLMLNVMLSFAQYERELTGERIRDKIEASKKKGIWMGGVPSIGYDVCDRKLVINEAEAKIVKLIFANFIETESVMETVKEVNRLGFLTKSWVTQKGKLQKGKKFDQKNIRGALSNPIYIGKITHKGKVYDGQHQPIIANDIWKKVEEILGKNQGVDEAHAQSSPQSNRISMPVSRVSLPPLLKGVIHCGVCNRKMAPTYTKKQGRRYRYYLCTSKAGGDDSCKTGRISANEVENLVISQMLSILKKPEFIVHTLAQAAGKISESVVINSFKQIEKVWDELFPLEQARIVNLLIKKITLNPDGMNLEVFEEGLISLSNELNG